MLTLPPQRQCIRNLQVVLEAAESSLDDVVEVNVFLSDMKDFAQMNEVYGEYWGKVKPSRTYVAVSSVSHRVLLLTSGGSVQMCGRQNASRAYGCRDQMCGTGDSQGQIVMELITC